MIPLKLHMLWLPPHPEMALPHDVSATVQAWQAIEPHLELRVWSKEEALEESGLTTDFDIRELVGVCRFPAMQADILRLALVHHLGGFWCDLKNYPLAPFISDLSHLDGAVVAEHFPIASRPDPADFLCNSFFGSEVHSTFISMCLEEVATAVSERRSGSVFGISGGAVFMRVRRKIEEMAAPAQLSIMRYEVLWHKFIKRVNVTYNDNEMHWSSRQKVEPLYISL